MSEQSEVLRRIMTNNKVRWEEMFLDEIQNALDKCPVCLLAYGLAEPHGPYNAIGLDFIKANSLLEKSAEINGGVVAPPFAWHIQERPEFDWLGAHGVKQSFCSSIPADLFLKVVLYQIRAIDARGFHVGILVTGHYGGPEKDIRLLCDFYTRKTNSPLRLRAFADWELISFDNYGGDHAGIVETSQLMFLRPDLVDLQRSVQKATDAFGLREKSQFGRFCGTSFPTVENKMPGKELGEKIVNSQIKRLGKIQKQLLLQYKAPKDWQAPSLNDVEDIWIRFERLTRKYWICSKTFEEYKNKINIEFPGWEALGE